MSQGSTDRPSLEVVDRSGDGIEPTPIRRSVEVEYWVIDTEGRLADPEPLVDAAPGVEREFVVPVIEIKTSPCETTEALQEELFDRIQQVLKRANKRGLGLVPLATPIHADSIEDLPSERTRIQDRVVGDRFECVRHCAGTHIHVEQQPGRAIDQLNTLTALDPALALVNSSPYYKGSYLTTGARSLLYRRIAYDSLPRQGQLWPYAGSTEEWAKRLEYRYGEFKTAATMAGIDRNAVESQFDPESAVWTPVKLREQFSTVEWRSPDTALPSQIIRLADEIVGVIRHLQGTEVRIEGTTGHVEDSEIVLPEFEAVEDYVDAAIQDGLSSKRVRSYLDRMGFTPSAYDPISTEIGTREELSGEEARQLRIEFATRLENDLRRTRQIRAD